METCGDRIKMCRKALKMTQAELGQSCKVTKQTIFKYETGIVSNIPFDKLSLIADALHVSTAYLLGLNENAVHGSAGVDLSPQKQALCDYVITLSDDQAQRLLQMAQAAFDG